MSLPPITVDDEQGNVISIEVAERWRGRYGQGCSHARISLDVTLAQVTCRDCKALLNPVEWIARAAERWAAIQALYERQEQSKRELDLKRRAKCPQCGAISEIRHPTAAEIRAWDAQDRSRRIKDGSLIIVGPAPRDGEG